MWVVFFSFPLHLKVFINLFSLKQKFNERQIKSILNQVKIVLKKKRNQNEKQILLSVSLCCAQSRVAAGSSLAVGLDLLGPEPSSASASPLQNHSNPSQQHCRHHQPPRYSCVVYADFFPSNSSSFYPQKIPQSISSSQRVAPFAPRCPPHSARFSGQGHLVLEQCWDAQGSYSTCRESTAALHAGHP